MRSCREVLKALLCLACLIPLLCSQAPAVQASVLPIRHNALEDVASIGAKVANPRWQILVLVYAETDFSYTDDAGSHRIVASMTAAERERADSVSKRFFEEDVPALTSGAMSPIVTVRYPSRTLTDLDSACGYWPSPGNTAPELDPAFDSVVVIWDSSGTDMATGQPAWLQNCGGLSLPMGTGQTYCTFPVDSVSDGQRNVFKHEWGHSILFYYDSAGVTPKPAVNNHINATDTRYVHCPTGEEYILQDETDANPIPNSIYNNARGFTHDYYSGTTAVPEEPGRCLGISDAAWATGGPVTKPAAPTYTAFVPHVSTGQDREALLFVSSSFAAEGRVAVIDTATRSVVARVRTDAVGQGIVSASDGKFVYVADSSANRISVIDTDTRAVFRTIAVGQGPVMPAISPDGRRLYVANYGSNSVSVVDTASSSVVGTLENAASAWGAAVSPDGQRVAVSLYWSGAVVIFNTDTFARMAEIAVGQNPQGLLYHPDGSRLYVANLASSSVSVIDTGTNQVIHTISVANGQGNNPVQMTLNSTGTRLYVANDNAGSVSEIDTVSHTVLRQISVGSGPRDVELVSGRLYVTNANSGTISVVDLELGQTVATISGLAGAHSLAVVR